MAGVFTRAGLRFLYRSEEGTIDRRLWWLGLIPLASILLVMTIVWLAISPWATRGLNERAFIDARTLAAYAYLATYAFAVILIAVCYTMLSAKRLRARNMPLGLAGLVPLAALVAGAAHWLYPRVADVMHWAIAPACDGLLLAAIAWTIRELGFRDSTK